MPTEGSDPVLLEKRLTSMEMSIRHLGEKVDANSAIATRAAELASQTASLQQQANGGLAKVAAKVESLEREKEIEKEVMKRVSEATRVHISKADMAKVSALAGGIGTVVAGILKVVA